MNAVCGTLAICPHQPFSHFRMPHSAFMYRCGDGLRHVVTGSNRYNDTCKRAFPRWKFQPQKYSADTILAPLGQRCQK